MKFFLVLALVSVACALDYNNKLSFNRLSTGGSYGSLLSGGSQYSIPIRGSSFGGNYGLRSLSSGYGSNYGAGTIALLGKFPPVAKLGYVQSNYGQSNYAQSSGPVYAAVQSTRNVQYVDGPSAQPAQPQTIVIGPSVQPLDFEFQSQSSPVNVRQTHIPSQPGPPQESSHTEEPDVLRQTITKPLIHEVHEEITPVRRISQVVNPVQEEINQLVTRGQQVQQQSYNYARPQASYQAVAVQPIQVASVQPAVQTVALQAVQPAAQLQTIALAQPAYSAGYSTGLSGLSGYSGLSGLSGLTLGGGSTYTAQPSYSTAEYTSTDNY